MLSEMLWVFQKKDSFIKKSVEQSKKKKNKKNKKDVKNVIIKKVSYESFSSMYK